MTTGSPSGHEPAQGLTVAITGPTGDIGRALLRALDHAPEVERVLAMARRPFDPAEHGLTKTEYRQGDVLDRAQLDDLFSGADVVVHLAFVIIGGLEETQRVNLEGSRNVFEAAVQAGADRLVYASSVAAYGFHEDNPQPLTEDISPRGTDRHYYSAQKAELETVLDHVLAGGRTAGYVFRPCIVAGPDALALLENIPYIQLRGVVQGSMGPLSGVIRQASERFPVLKPVLPDPGVPFQLVHHDDVATALQAAILGRGEPGVYNLAGPGEISMSDLAQELGWYSVPVPRAALDGLAELVARLPMLPTQAQWVESIRVPVLMDSAKARRRLDWEPSHTALETLREMVAAARQKGVV
jgi:nucleoside-diphosphate-sugar epimerase